MKGKPTEVGDEATLQTPANFREVLARRAGVGRVCAVVITYNRSELLKKVLSGLASQTRRPDTILVVNNASTDNTSDVIPEQTVQLDMPVNVGAAGGFSAGCMAAHEAGFEWVWILDDDVVPSDGCLNRLLNYGDDKGPALVRVPARVETDGHARIREAVIDFSRKTIKRVEQDEARVDIFTFEGPLIHRSVFDKVGYPDPRFFISADDTDFAIRVARGFGGGASVRVPEAMVQRLIAPPERIHILGLFPVVAESELWKTAYYLRNRHLVWRSLGWKRQQLRQIAIHAAFIAGDLVIAVAKGWDWRSRVRLNLRSFLQGLRGQGGVLVDPGEFRRSIRSRPASG